MKLKKVFVSGIFNILHPGHLRFLKFAKEQGDILYVGIIQDKDTKGNSFINEKERMYALLNNTLVDVWQKTELEISDYEENIEEQVITDMPQGMVVQYIPNGFL